ncbi:hypothetical protein [Glycomyces harbinensis]|uniref:Uncharacterized protein n=1 Tax=Glycomyces harbinensis TaxID=58114 RepID=A0A1G6QV79_9ACTN|nr:hypothetical protein [Glycomyces harbinensis]SDC95597.1 hypothetical protein SAMN05216270_101101 [Glycomyces harbinensis]
MDYSINFAATVPPARLKAVVLAQWPLASDMVFADTAEVFEEYEGPKLIVLIQSGLHPGSDFDTELSAGQEFADVVGGLDELQLTTLLCKALEARALIPDGGRSGLTWMLVTEDGWHGRVVLRDDDVGDAPMVIDHALQPVPVAPEIPVQDPPAWERGWYDDGMVPTSGYLESD